jgi:hypothetical protein
MLELVRQKTIFVSKNDLFIHDINVAPGIVWDDLNTYSKENNTSMTVSKLEKGNGFLLTQKAEGEEEQGFTAKVKFYGYPGENKDALDKYNIRFKFE